MENNRNYRLQLIKKKNFIIFMIGKYTYKHYQGPLVDDSKAVVRESSRPVQHLGFSSPWALRPERLDQPTLWNPKTNKI